jgi:hypothetical protein|tara:strand:- start:537 stop:710 length:174 start_codon:yes stop_codon:yes gene_type:complete
MELLFKAEDILSYNQLMEWDKNDLAEYILNCTYVKFPEDSYDEDDGELPYDKLIAKI